MDPELVICTLLYTSTIIDISHHAVYTTGVYTRVDIIIIIYVILIGFTPHL